MGADNSRQRRGNPLGRASTTITGDGSSIKFFDTYRKRHGKGAFSDMAYIEIEEDNLEYVITELAQFACSTPIPRYHRGDFEPPPRRRGADEDAPITIIKASALQQYIGNIIKLIQYKFPEHDDFKDLDVRDPYAVPSWWSRLRPEFERQCERCVCVNLATGSGRSPGHALSIKTRPFLPPT